MHIYLVSGDLWPKRKFAQKGWVNETTLKIQYACLIAMWYVYIIRKNRKDTINISSDILESVGVRWLLAMAVYEIQLLR